MIKIRKITFLSIFLLFSILSYGNLILELSNSEIYKEQNFELRVIFENIDMEDFQVEGIENFITISQGTSNNISLINGRKTQRIIKTYRLRPKDVGEFNLRVISKNYESNIGKIKISNIRPQGNKELFTTFRDVEKREYFFGEKILLREGIESKVNLSALNYINKQEIENARVKDINQGRIQSETKNIEGVPHLIATSFYALINPLASGKLTIHRDTIRVAYEEISDDFFRSRQINEDFLSFDEINLNILPLPPYDDLKNYKGLVGEVDINISLNKTKVEVGEGINLRVSLKGYANLEVIDKIFEDSIEGFRIFENPLELQEEIRNGKYYSEKEFEIILIPLKGELSKIPDVEIPYFDPVEKKYKKAVSKGENIQVTGDNPSKINTVEDISNDRELIKIETINQISKSNYNKYLLFIVLLQFFLILFLIFLLFKDKMKGANNKKTPKYFIRQINKAKNSKEIYELLKTFFKQNYNISLETSSFDSLKKNNAIPKDLPSIIIKLEEDLYGNLEMSNTLKVELINILKDGD